MFQRPPWSRDHHVVHPATAPVHREFHRDVLQNLRKARAAELAARIRVEDLGPSMASQRRFQHLDAKFDIHRAGEPPRQPPSRRPIHDREEIDEPALHRNAGDVGTPDLTCRSSGFGANTGICDAPGEAPSCAASDGRPGSASGKRSAPSRSIPMASTGPACCATPGPGRRSGRNDRCRGAADHRPRAAASSPCRGGRRRRSGSRPRR